MDVQDFIIITPFWERPEVTKVYCEQIKREGYRLISVVSPEDPTENHDIVKEVSEVVLPVKNVTGLKFNAGIKKAKKMDCKFVVIAGSDVLISKRYFMEYLIPNAEEHQYMGIKDYLDYFPHNGRFKYWPGYTDERKGEPVGSGKAISIELLREIKGYLFDNVMRGTIDYSSHKKLEKFADPLLFELKKKPYKISIRSSNKLSLSKTSDYRHRVNMNGYYDRDIIDMIKNL